MNARALLATGAVFSLFAACSVSLDGYAGPPLEDTPDAPAETSTSDVGTEAGPDAADAAPEASLYATTILGDKPILYFRLGETQGASGALDLITGRRGGYRGVPVLGVPGAIANDSDTAMRLDGTNGVTLSGIARFGGTVPYSLEAWAHPTDVSVSGHVVVAAEYNNNDGYALFFYQSYSPAMEREYATGDDIAGTDQVVSQTGYSHLVGTYDGKTESLYINGQLVGTKASANGIPATTTVPFAIGGNNQADDNPFIGDIDEVAIYDYAIDAATIANHYKVGIGKSP